MDYLRTFYPQKGKFQASLSFTNDEYNQDASFGLSGTGGTVAFSCLDDFININNVFCSSLEESKETTFVVCGNSGNVTVWKDDSPIIHLFPSGGFNFHAIFCSAASGSTFSESLLGQSPGLGHSFSGWNESLKSGNITLFNSGEFPLDVTSGYMANSAVRTAFSPFQIGPSSSGSIPVYYEGNSAFSGTGLFTVNTNAGDYSFNQYFNLDFFEDPTSIDVFFESGILYPSGETNFFIRNNKNSDATVGLFFDYFERQDLIIKTGSATYANPTGGITSVNYTGGGFYKTIPGSGGFSVFATSGQTDFSVNYTGNFTGIGGRLGATGVQLFSGSSNVSIPGAVPGYNTYYISRDVEVYEGNGNHYDLWTPHYNDVDRGAENFKTLGRYTSSGFGVSGTGYRIPATGVTSGRMVYSSNYNESIFQSLILRVTHTSLESSAYIGLR